MFNINFFTAYKKLLNSINHKIEKILSKFLPLKNTLITSKLSSLKSNGFLLVEAAIVLAIIGIISYISLEKLKLTCKYKQLNVTIQNIQYVSDAIVLHFLKTNSLPDPDQSSEIQCGSDKIIGAVPYKILGLSKKQVIDGYGHRLLYAVDIQAISNLKNDVAPTSLPLFAPISPQNNQTILDVSYDELSSILSSNPDNAIAFLVDSSLNVPIVRNKKFIFKSLPTTRWILSKDLSIKRSQYSNTLNF